MKKTAINSGTSMLRVIAVFHLVIDIEQKSEETDPLIKVWHNVVDKNQKDSDNMVEII